MTLSRHVDRRLLDVVTSRLDEAPVIGLQGPRSVGKSTLLAAVAAAAGVQILDLDQPEVRATVETDPSMFVTGPSPVCIDEYQRAPIILDAIKAELNRDLRPGRFVITGSTRHDARPRAAQALTGRLQLLNIRPLAQAELEGRRSHFIDQCLEEPAALKSRTPSRTTREAYIERVVAGGLPLPLRLPSGPARRRWFDDYVSQVVERDLLELSKVRQRVKLPALLARLAGQTGQVLKMASAARDVDLEVRTAENYTKLLEAVFLIQLLPAWGTTLSSRAGTAPKIHVVDSGLAARLLRLTPERLASRQPAALTEFGHLLETFVVGELLAQASWSELVGGHGHWRTRGGDEVDLVLERDDGAIVAFEVKAGARVLPRDVGGLRRLRNVLGDRFIGGVVLSTGKLSSTLEDRIHVLPIDRMWS